MGTRKVALILLTLALSACTAPEPLSLAAAQTILAQTWQADQHSVWEVEWPAAPTGGPLTVETWRAGSRYRFEVLEATAPDLVGQVLIFDGQTAWRYRRFDQPQASAQSEEARLSPVTDAFAVISRLLVTAPETATQEALRLPSGPAQKLTFTYPNGDKLALWRDESTGLPVRVAFTLDGQSATLRARSFVPLPDPPEGLFKP
ncbi:MAG: hypothetical protein BroJett011_00090 [Chloroflexota bacterium]|nr:MAG: hypothetical protein BroJett011_00090 [Chloroflexota bacterium]